MIFLRKLYLKAEACKFFSKRKYLSGQVTVWLALSFLVFLSLYLICLQSVQKQYQRQQAEQTAESSMFSLFSEFEPHLLENYDLFFLDTSFKSGKEQTDRICSHLWNFAEDNLTGIAGKPLYGLKMQGINVKDLVRATDNSGLVFYQQAIRIMKERTGVSFAEEWIFQDQLQETIKEDSKKFQQDCEKYENVVKNYEDEDDVIESEAYQWDGAWNNFISSMAIPSNRVMSARQINLASVPSHRELSVGAGKAKGNEGQILQKQWFISYLCEYLKNAQEMLSTERPGGYLDYQLEYVICGKASDQENLNQVILDLLLIREGTNYAFLLTHPNLSKKAGTLAKLLVGLTGNAALIEGVKHLIMLSWAYGESLVEVRQLLEGYELSMVKAESDWQVPLHGLLLLILNPGKYDNQVGDQKGFSYESFLRILLTAKSKETLAMRSLDIIEGELQQIDGCEKIHLDHCVEKLTMEVWFQDIYLERTYGYE